MRGRARRDREIEHDSEEAEPKGLCALGGMVERGGQGLGLFRAGLAVAGLRNRFPSRVVEHRRRLRPSRAVRLKPSQLADGGQGGAARSASTWRKRDRNGETVRAIKLLGMSQTRRN